ncbi:MAG: DUF1080 domain-containing protein [Planctomycetota bacterium]|nr:DUF1080 domain-containing protein [Planctomycetota bacterium]
MFNPSFHLALFGFTISALIVAGAEPQSPKQPATTIVTPTQLIVATAFDQATPLMRKKPIHGWSAAIGQWQVKDGVLHGDEVAEDNHPSSCTWKLDATDMVITAQFKLGTATHVAFGCRDSIAPHHHLGRTYISQDAIWVVRQSGISKTSKSEKLAELKTPMDPNAWHDITIEISGDHYRATVNSHVVEAHHERYKDAKGLVALITKGEGAQFKNVAIWSAKPKAK